MSELFCRLGDIFDFKNGRAFKKEEWATSGLPIIRIQNLNNLSASFNYFNGEYDKSIEVNFGDLLFSWSGTVGTSFGPHIWSRDKGLLNQHIYKLKFKKDINVRYAHYALLSITSDIEKSVVGAVGLVHVTKKSLNEFKISLPDLKTQQKIVEKLDEIFAEIDRAVWATEANIKNVEALFKTYLTEVFEVGRSKNDLYNIGSFLKLEYGKGLDESDRAKNGAYPVYGANGIKSKTNKFLFDEPSIIVGRKGSAGELTLVFEKFWPLDVTYYVTHDKDKTDIQYLYYGLLAQNLPQYAKGVKPGINRNDVYGLKMRLPALNEQKQLALTLTALSEKVNSLLTVYKTKIETLSFMKKSILLQAFNGELFKE